MLVVSIAILIIVVEVSAVIFVAVYIVFSLRCLVKNDGVDLLAMVLWKGAGSYTCMKKKCLNGTDGPVISIKCAHALDDEVEFYLQCSQFSLGLACPLFASRGIFHGDHVEGHAISSQQVGLTLHPAYNGL